MDPGKGNAVLGVCGGGVGMEGVFCRSILHMCVHLSCVCVSMGRLWRWRRSWVSSGEALVELRESSFGK